MVLLIAFFGAFLSGVIISIASNNYDVAFFGCLICAIMCVFGLIVMFYNIVTTKEEYE